MWEGAGGGGGRWEEEKGGRKVEGEREGGFPGEGSPGS